jgi:hypothetical protein
MSWEGSPVRADGSSWEARGLDFACIGGGENLKAIGLINYEILNSSSLATQDIADVTAESLVI